MTCRISVFLIVINTILSTALTTWSVAGNFHYLTFFSLLIFCFTVILFADGIGLLARPRDFHPSRNSYSSETMWWNTLLTSIVYAWGALCLLSVYILSGIFWFHGVQYRSRHPCSFIFFILVLYRLEFKKASNTASPSNYTCCFTRNWSYLSCLFR